MLQPERSQRALETTNVPRRQRPCASRVETKMEYRVLGRSGLKVSVVAFGAAAFGGAGELALRGSVDLNTARRQIGFCLEAGVNLLDTANAYTRGKSEEILGEALLGKRDQVLVATKVRFAVGDGPNDEGLSRHHIITQCEASLKRLRTDHIDLYQLGEWDGLTSLDETLDAVDTLVRSGKVRYVGISNFTGWQLMKTMEVARANRVVQPIAQQIHYSLETRDAEYELIPASIDQGLGVLVWSPLSGGLLSGKYRRGGRHLNDWHVPPIVDRDKLYDKIEVLIQIADGRGVSAAEVALAWLLGRPGVTSLIVGARTEDQLRTNLRAAELTLSAEERAHLDAREPAHPPLSLLAPTPDGRRTAWPGRSQLARVAYEGVIAKSDTYWPTRRPALHWCTVLLLDRSPPDSGLRVSYIRDDRHVTEPSERVGPRLSASICHQGMGYTVCRRHDETTSVTSL